MQCMLFHILVVVASLVSGQSSDLQLDSLNSTVKPTLVSHIHASSHRDFSSPSRLAISSNHSSSDEASSDQDDSSHTSLNVTDPGFILLPLFTIGSEYYADLEMGSSMQPVTVRIDTASSDLWVIGSSVNCLASTYNCTGFGVFDPSLSSTYSVNRRGPYYYNVGVQPWYTIGKWGTDDVVIGNSTVSGVTFAVATTSDSRYGYLGIGPPSSESTNVNDGFIYDNFPLQLVSQGLIYRNVYSIFLNASPLGTGSVLFGAVDMAKLLSPLQTVPLINTGSDINDFTIVLGEIKFSQGDDSTGLDSTSFTGRRWPAVLDTTLNVTQFPAAMAQQILRSSVFQYQSSGAYVVDDAVLDSSFITFNFSGAAIDVPLKAFIVPLLSPTQVNLTILARLASTVFFGADVLRYMYRVYDIDRKQLSIAQANYTDDEDVHLVLDNIPSALLAVLYSMTLVGYIPSLATGVLVSLSAGAPPSDFLQRSHGFMMRVITLLCALCLM